MTTIPSLVQADDIVAARELLSDVISPTPLLYSRVLSDQVGGPVYLKCENLQRTGSFKVRGAYVRIARLSDAERARGVVAASAGNHAQGVAFAAGLLGTTATVVMPERAPLPKVQATRGYGASVVLHGSSVEDALEEALRFAAAHRKRCSSTRSTTRTSWRARERSASRSSSSARRSRTVAGPGRRRRPGGGDRRRGARASIRRSGSSACRPSRWRPTRRRSPPGTRSRRRRCPRWPTA